MSAGKGVAGKADALNRGRLNRRPGVSAVPLPATPEPPSESRQAVDVDVPRTEGGGRAPAGKGRRGHLRKLSLELTPDEHDRLKMWLINAFGGNVKATPVLRALLAEAYADTGLTERVRRRLESRD